MYMLMNSLRDEAVVSRLLRLDTASADVAPEVSKSNAKRLIENFNQAGGGGTEGPQQPFRAPTADELAAMAQRRQQVAQQAPPPKRPAKGAEAKAYGLANGIGRNEPCPCGSGNKFKKCCMKAA